MTTREVPGASTVPANTKGPPACDWVMKYLTAPGTTVHETEILVSVSAVAVTPVGAGRTNCSVSVSLSEGSSPAQAFRPTATPMAIKNDCGEILMDMAAPL